MFDVLLDQRKSTISGYHVISLTVCLPTVVSCCIDSVVSNSQIKKWLYYIQPTKSLNIKILDCFSFVSRCFGVYVMQNRWMVCIQRLYFSQHLRNFKLRNSIIVKEMIKKLNLCSRDIPCPYLPVSTTVQRNMSGENLIACVMVPIARTRITQLDRQDFPIS